MVGAVIVVVMAFFLPVQGGVFQIGQNVDRRARTPERYRLPKQGKKYGEKDGAATHVRPSISSASSHTRPGWCRRPHVCATIHCTTSWPTRAGPTRRGGQDARVACSFKQDCACDTAGPALCRRPRSNSADAGSCDDGYPSPPGPWLLKQPAQGSLLKRRRRSPAIDRNQTLTASTWEVAAAAGLSADHLTKNGTWVQLLWS